MDLCSLSGATVVQWCNSSTVSSEYYYVIDPGVKNISICV